MTNPILENLQMNGISIIPSGIDTEILDRLREEYRVALQDHVLINNESYIFISRPYITCPTIVEIACLPILEELAQSYLKEEVQLGTCNLRRSKPSSRHLTTNFFHSDKNMGLGVSFVKFFFYLHDVEEDGGAFEYILGSHREKFPGWQNPYRQSDDTIYGKYDKDRSLLAAAKYGDIIVADTTGFHRGSLSEQTRDMLTLNFVRGKESDNFEVLEYTIPENSQHLFKHLRTV